MHDARAFIRQRPRHSGGGVVGLLDAKAAGRKAPTDHTRLRDLCALHYDRKVHENHTVRLNGQVIDIPKRRDGRPPPTPGRTWW